ncbi:hypothetical protein F5890DRAFT_1512318 [Lentinula detonsa]|uniref:Uncharacterized protein n=1 Tax=Lentinula detonsa TaxID=2804962 RepID=A0AA38UUU4_9AGAR|nr:hypothetical protein F5890DRAFT_1512318 [Lentinula detonsa]
MYMESHLLAKELKDANVGHSWDIRRISPGPPLSQDTVISKLMDYNITVGISVFRDLFHTGIGMHKICDFMRKQRIQTARDSDGRINEEQALHGFREFGDATGCISTSREYRFCGYCRW